jgi:hypothetical protein
MYLKWDQVALSRAQRSRSALNLNNAALINANTSRLLKIGLKDDESHI